MQPLRACVKIRRVATHADGESPLDVRSSEKKEEKKKEKKKMRTETREAE